MNSTVYRLRLDIHSPTSQDLINMNKGETARRIEIEFCENNASYKLGDNVTAVICISDDTTLYPVKIDGNKVVYEPLAELTGSVGIKDVQVRLMQSNNDTVNPENAETDRLLYSPLFSVAVHDVLNDGSTVEEQAKQGDVIAQINEVLRKADTGEFNGQDGKDGIDGADGYSPKVTVTTSVEPQGHYVTITDAEHPQGQAFFVPDGQGGGSGLSFPVFVIEWKTNPTTNDKTTIVSKFDAMSQIGGHRYIAKLKVGSDVLDGVTYGNNKATFFDFGSAVPKVYTISASSLEAYKQTSEYFYNTILFDENSDIPASQAVITDYIKGKLLKYVTEEYVNEKTKELSKVYVNSEQPTDFTDKDIWVDTSDSQMPVISAGSTTVALGGEVYDAIQEALGSVETELETITTGGGVA